MYAYYREIFPVAMKLVEIFGVALGVDRGCHEDDDENENENGSGDGGLEKDFQWPIWGMRALHYPPSWGEEEVEGEGEDGDEERMGLGAHKDFSWVTLVLQDEVGGLEVLNSEGKWIDVPPREGTLVVNVGQVSLFSRFLYSLFSLFSSFALLAFFTFFLFRLFPPIKSQSQSLTPLSPIHNKLTPPPPPPPSLFSVPRTPNQLPLPRNHPSRPQQIRPRTKKKIFHPLLSQSQPPSHTQSSSQLCKSRRGNSPGDQCRGFVYSKGVAGEEETSDECQVEKCARDGVEV